MCKKREKKKMCPWKNETMHRLRSWIFKWKGQNRAHKGQGKDHEKIISNETRAFQLKIELYVEGGCRWAIGERNPLHLILSGGSRVKTRAKMKNTHQITTGSSGRGSTWESGKGGRNFKAGNIEPGTNHLLTREQRGNAISYPKCAQNIEV